MSPLFMALGLDPVAVGKLYRIPLVERPAER